MVKQLAHTEGIAENVFVPDNEPTPPRQQLFVSMRVGGFAAWPSGMREAIE